MTRRQLATVAVAAVLALAAQARPAAADEKLGTGIVEYDCGDRSCSCTGGPTSDDCEKLKREGWCRSAPGDDTWTMTIVCCPKTQTCCCSIGNKDQSACACASGETPRAYRFEGTGVDSIRGRSTEEKIVERSGGAASSCPEPPPQVAPAPRAGFVWIAGAYDLREGKCVLVPGHWERPRRDATKGTSSLREDVPPDAITMTCGPRPAAGTPSGRNTDVGSLCPDPPEDAAPPSRAGFAWVAAAYDLREGKCVLVPGHWERPKR